jgi:hypothetical protein
MLVILMPVLWGRPIFRLRSRDAFCVDDGIWRAL